ncbi:MAG: hypothetical protein ACRD1V_14390 [Vicinamibacterales bacterium]
MSGRRGRRPFVVESILALLILNAGLAAAQAPSTPQRIEFDRPEAWAMKYFTSASLLVAPSVPSAGLSRVRLGLDVVALPPLSTAQQRVGFNGTAQEDLNQAPVFVRPRLELLLSDKWTLVAAGVPPVRAFGITPRLFAMGVAFYASRGPAWTVSAFGHGQIGDVSGAITCPADVLRFSPGSEGNPRGCDKTSADATTLRYASIEVDVDRSLSQTGRWSAHSSAGVNLMDNVFQTNAQTFGFTDRTELASRGLTYDASLGVRYAVGRFELGGDVLYAPLTIRRPSEAASITSLLTVRSVVMYRVR